MPPRHTANGMSAALNCCGAKSLASCGARSRVALIHPIGGHSASPAII
jgi:hypothetical protein